MDHPYHITVFDNFHPHEPEEAWVGATFATAEAAIAAVKRKIDDELAYLWSEVCHQDKGISTLDRLVSQYNSFAEMPVACSRDGDMIFDSTAYMLARAAEMIDKAPAPYGLQAAAGQPGPRTPQGSSLYSATRQPPAAASDRNHSMWQLERAATRASSGSTAASTDIGTRTTCGEDEAGTSTPPSKCQVWPRL